MDNLVHLHIRKILLPIFHINSGKVIDIIKFSNKEFMDLEEIMTKPPWPKKFTPWYRFLKFHNAQIISFSDFVKSRR